MYRKFLLLVLRSVKDEKLRKGIKLERIWWIKREDEGEG
jgi:hypothetical protein